MEIKNKCDFVCEPCIMGKLTNSRNKTPAIRAQSPLEFVSSDMWPYFASFHQRI